MKSFKGKHRLKLTIFTLIFVVALIFTGYQLLYKTGEIVDEGNALRFRSRAKNVGDLLEEMQISLEPEDIVEPEVTTPLKTHLTLTIYRSKEYVVKDANSGVIIRSAHNTPETILQDADITLGPYDIVTPSPQSNIEEGETIVIERVEYQEVDVPQTISFRSYLREAEEGEEEGTIWSEGKTGELVRTYLQRKVNGVIVSEQLISTTMVSPPQDEIFLVAAVEIEREEKPAQVARAETPRTEEKKTETAQPPTEEPVEVPEEIPPEETPPVEEETENDRGEGEVFEATAYCLQGLTATGVPSGPGKVATDPKVIPMGTRLYVESMDGWPDYGECVAADVGGGIKGNKIDLFFESCDTCIEFGRRKVKVYILD